MVSTVGGCCKSHNVIYLFVCNMCHKHYVGNSTKPLRTRVGEHRGNFYRMCGKSDFKYDNKNLMILPDLDSSYVVSILDIFSPIVHDIKEGKFIYLPNSLTPSGLNLSNPFVLPLLYRQHYLFFFIFGPFLGFICS